MPNNGKAYQYRAVRGGMTRVNAAPKATVEPSTTNHLGPRAPLSPVGDLMIEARLRPDFAEVITIRGRMSIDRNRSVPEACRVTARRQSPPA
jgi:hypothetical protein